VHWHSPGEVGVYHCTCHISLGIFRWKNFENRFTSAKVIIKHPKVPVVELLITVFSAARQTTFLGFHNNPSTNTETSSAFWQQLLQKSSCYESSSVAVAVFLILLHTHTAWRQLLHGQKFMRSLAILTQSQTQTATARWHRFGLCSMHMCCSKTCNDTIWHKNSHETSLLLWCTQVK